MTKLSTILLAATGLLAFSTSADAERIQALEEAHELPTDYLLAMTDKDPGELVFKACEQCAASRLKMSATTYFEVNRRQVTKKTFWTALRRSKGNVYLFVDIRSGNVTRIKLDG